MKPSQYEHVSAFERRHTYGVRMALEFDRLTYTTQSNLLERIVEKVRQFILKLQIKSTLAKGTLRGKLLDRAS